MRAVRFRRWLHRTFRAPAPEQWVAAAHEWNRWHDDTLRMAVTIDLRMALGREADGGLIGLRKANDWAWRRDAVMHAAVTAAWPERYRDRRIGPGWDVPWLSGKIRRTGWSGIEPNDRLRDVAATGARPDLPGLCPGCGLLADSERAPGVCCDPCFDRAPVAIDGFHDWRKSLSMVTAKTAWRADVIFDALAKDLRAMRRPPLGDRPR